MRSDVTFRSGDVDCAAWLYRPVAASEWRYRPADGSEPADRIPLVVMAHGFSATREQRLDAYAERFCAAGFGVLLFDYRHFGASAGEPRQLLDVPRQLADWRAAIAYTRTIDWVDADRIALFGSSFSGGHALTLSAEDGRVATVVAQCPYTDSLASLPKLGLRTVLRSTVAALRDEVDARRGRSPSYIPVTAPPGGFAVFTTPDAESGFRAITPSETTWENRVAARIMLRILAYRPGRAAARIACPVLLCACENDVITPARTAIRYVKRAPRHEIRRYPVGHFDIYVGDAFERAVADQTAFLCRTLGLGEPSVGASAVPVRA